MELSATQVVTWNQPGAPAGITPQKVYIGPVVMGLPGFQVAVATASSAPSRPALRDLFTTRKGQTQTQLVVAVTYGSTTYLFGPDPQSQPIELPTELAHRQLQSVLAEPDALSASDRWAGFRKAHDSSGGPGFSNSGLFATHHITQNVPHRPDWSTLNQTGSGMLSARSKNLIEALGFKLRPASSGTFLLATSANDPRAIAVLLEDSENFDGKSSRFQLSPVAFGLAVAAQERVPWLVVLRKDQIRLYPGRDGVGVGSKGQSETFFEVDLSTVDAGYAGLLPLVFSADALAADGTADQLLRDSARYATELGARLRERIYEHVVPTIAVEVAQQLAKSTRLALDSEGLSTAYRVTLRILFRLLFQAYAEDRGLLPSGRNEGFDANSLKTNAARLLVSDGVDFGEASTIWRDLEQVWNAIDQGNPQWQIPAYNGGLFSTDAERSPDGALIDQIKLPDSVLGPALRHLLIDRNSDGDEGPVDFRSLSVREFGTIYEGLLESSLSLAEQDLTVDNSGAWVPAKDGDEILANAGAVYFHSASGERKATGSYFTPKVVVDHLIERSVVPALTAHLEKIAGHLAKGDAAGAARDFFDFRVADLAMGSGHFLVAAVDKIEALMRTFLTEHAVPGVTDELLRLAAVARDALGTDDVAKSEVDEIGLLRRQVARRCIYGLDINPMSVELARLALWIHTFVPGLPMSNLDHGLVCANSLTGIGAIDEALDALQPDRLRGQGTFFDDVILGNLSTARTLLVDVANASEADKREVEQGAKLLAQAAIAAEPTRRIFDTAVAARLGAVQASAIVSEESLRQVADLPIVRESVERLTPAHMPYLFPEVFLRDRPGFDVLLGNPPWEKVQVDERAFWALRFPGLRGMSVADQRSAMNDYRRKRPELVTEFESEVASNDSIRDALLRGDFPGLGSGHPDLYKAFAWRFWKLLRPGGVAGLVMPRSAATSSGMAEWRGAVFDEGCFSDVTMLHNTGGWVFPEVHPQDRFVLLALAKSLGDEIVTLRGPFESETEFSRQRSPLVLDASEVRGWGSGDALPWLPAADSGPAFVTLTRHPRFGDERPDFRFRAVQGDFNTTTHASEFLFDDSGDWPVYKGGSIGLWQPDTGVYFATANSTSIVRSAKARRASQVRNSRSAFSELAADVARAEETLPLLNPRIAFADITNQSNTRTMIVALVPPNVVLTHKAPYLLRIAGSRRDEAYVLGLLSSIPLDWYARRYVEKTLSFEILNAFPVPCVAEDNVLRQRVIEIAGRLAAVDQRFADWAASVGVPVGTVNTVAEKDDLVAELDALASLLYGLTEDQVEHVFATFHRGWNYEPRLKAVLDHYRQWKGRA